MAHLHKFCQFKHFGVGKNSSKQWKACGRVLKMYELGYAVPFIYSRIQQKVKYIQKTQFSTSSFWSLPIFDHNNWAKIGKSQSDLLSDLISVLHINVWFQLYVLQLFNILVLYILFRLKFIALNGNTLSKSNIMGQLLYRKDDGR